jgi:REP element-mobilizing transposase RayT
MARALQLSLPPARTWGGRRAGAGRKLTPGGRAGVPHRTRPAHVAAYPLHITLRAGRTVRCLRASRVFPAVCRALAAASHGGFRVLHFSVQDDHVHLIVEADDTGALGRGLRGLAIRVARAVNRALGRRGRVWSDRYHARPLTTPREVRHCLVYVLLNWRKHCEEERGLDPCSSALWFDGWRDAVARAPAAAPVVRARTWLAAVGWRRHGLLGIDERPRAERGRNMRTPRPRREADS